MEEINDIKGPIERLAEERNALSRIRTRLAHERTFSAWVRTGMAAMAAGLGVFHLLGAVGGPLLSRMIGIIFVAAGGGIYIVAMWRYYQGYHDLKRQGIQMTSILLLGGLIFSLVLSAILALALMFD